MALSNDEMKSISDKMVDVFKTIYDPEIPVDIYELGLIYDAQINAEGHARILMTLTSPNCPVAESLPAEVENKTKEIEGVEKVDLTLTFEPPWDKDMISDEAKFELGLL